MNDDDFLCTNSKRRSYEKIRDLFCNKKPSAKDIGNILDEMNIIRLANESIIRDMPRNLANFIDDLKKNVSISIENLIEMEDKSFEGVSSHHLFALIVLVEQIEHEILLTMH
jgi:hypothetical protein